MTEWNALLRLAVAAGLGGVIGFEREHDVKAAGLRTHMLVTLGSALFTVTSLLLVQQFESHNDAVGVDPTRIPSYIVAGIGFIGGGIIFRSRHGVRNVTTAAGVWVAAGVGMAVGAGYYIVSIGSVVLTLIVLYVVKRLEKLHLISRDEDAGQS